MSIISIRMNLPSNPDVMIIRNTIGLNRITIDRKTGVIHKLEGQDWLKLNNTAEQLDINTGSFPFQNLDDLFDDITIIDKASGNITTHSLPYDLNHKVGSVIHHHIVDESSLLFVHSPTIYDIIFRLPGYGIMYASNGSFTYQLGASSDPMDATKIVQESTVAADVVKDFKNALIEFFAQLH